MTKEQAEFLRNVGEDYGLEIDLREGYSGCGMFGRETYGIVTDNPMELLCAAINYMKGLCETTLKEEVPNFPNNGFSTDSMGRQTIIY